MKKQPSLLVALLITSSMFFSCSEEKPKLETEKPMFYFENTEQPIQTGGVQLIPIETPKGKFNIWTKRIGNNPTIKILLLNGEPGCKNEYLECFESFFPKV